MPPALSQTLMIDNGAYTIKAGFVKQNAALEDCVAVPNCIARGRDRKIYIGPELENCVDFGGMSFRRPVERGYLVNWESEKEIWDRTFFDPESKLKCDPKKTTLILTEPPNNPAALQMNCDQIVFEEYEFGAYYRCIGASLASWNDVYTGAPRTQLAQCCLVVDSGHSFTHVIPVISGKVFNTAVRRIDIGGKFLTNYLKEMVSIRHYNMMDETHVMNEVKEACSFITTDFNRDLEKCKNIRNNDIVVDYVLPDYNEGKPGYRRSHVPKSGKSLGSEEQFMTLANERFTIPELIFNPSDCGMKQAGAAEVVMQALESVPSDYRDLLLGNIVLVGGNVNIPGFCERLEAELRPLAPADAVLRVSKPQDPVKYIWQCGVSFAQNKLALEECRITRAEYLEHGSSWVAKKFAGLPLPPAGSGPSNIPSHKKRRVSTDA